MSSNYDLRSALADALPAAGPTRAAVKAMDDIGYKADPKNSDMKELFVGLDLTASGSSGKEAPARAPATGEEGSAAPSAPAAPAALATEMRPAGGPSAAQALLDYRREKKAAQEAADLEAAALSAAGKGKGKGKGPEATTSSSAIGGGGLAWATELASLAVEEAAVDERHLRKVNLSRTAARMSSKQKRRRKNGKEHGASYEDRHAGKVVNKSKRKGRMLAMKQMY